MATRTIADSVTPVSGPPENLEELNAALDVLRSRFPGVIFGRYLGAVPRVAEDVFLAPGAAIIGDVEIGPQASVWYGCVLRGDVNRIVLGARSNLQDGAVVHLGDDESRRNRPPTDVSPGHSRPIVRRRTTTPRLADQRSPQHLGPRRPEPSPVTQPLHPCTPTCRPRRS